MPHIIKTAEMLKIKGLAEMSDAASLSKSDTKPSVAGMDQLSAGGSLNDGESVWGGHESQQQAQHQQFQPQQQQQQQTSQQQQQQQSQLQQQQQQQQMHLIHHQHVHQSRRTPSPTATTTTTMSPATRRKRLRKSSTGLEFTLRKDAVVQAAVATYGNEEEFRQAASAEEQAGGSSMEGIASMGGGTGAPTNIHIAHLDSMAAFGSPVTQRLIKEAESGHHTQQQQQHHHHNPHQIQHHDVEVEDQHQQHIIMVRRMCDRGMRPGTSADIALCLLQKTESHELQQQQSLPLDITTSAAVTVGGAQQQSGCSTQHAGERAIHVH